MEACNDVGVLPLGKEEATIVLAPPPYIGLGVGHVHLSSPNQEDAIVNNGERNSGG